MKRSENIAVWLFGFLITAFMIFTVICPAPSLSGVKRGLIISAQVIIPALFPFTVCVTFIMRCGITSLLIKSKRILGMSSECFTVFILSMIGGYPVGAGMINDLVSERKIASTKAERMLCYCVNSGPSFIVLAVGNGVLKSKALGYILLLSHILSSVILAIIFRDKNSSADIDKRSFASVNVAECFVECTARSANSVMSICWSVILFSAINSVFESITNGKLKFISLLTEITVAVTQTKNIYLISFLLGFSGLCVWFQIISSVKNFKINFPLFALSRILHGFFSAVITFLLIKIFAIKLPAVSNGVSGEFTPIYKSTSLAISLCCMVILLIIAIFGKNHSRNLAKDIV